MPPARQRTRASTTRRRRAAADASTIDVDDAPSPSARPPRATVPTAEEAPALTVKADDIEAIRAAMREEYARTLEVLRAEAITAAKEQLRDEIRREIASATPASPPSPIPQQPSGRRAPSHAQRQQGGRAAPSAPSPPHAPAHAQPMPPQPKVDMTTFARMSYEDRCHLTSRRSRGYRGMMGGTLL